MMKTMKRFLMIALALMLLLPAAGATEAGREPLKYGAQGERVVEVQKRLSELGYYTGKVSGNYLDGTQAAVKRFQKDYGMEETGILEEADETLLMQAEYRHLKFGDKGEDVKRVQEQLTKMEFYRGKLSGDYLAATRAGIKALQEKNGLEGTGEADIQTQQLLFSGKAIPKNPPKATPTPAPGMESDNPDDMGDINDVVMVDDGGQNNDQSLAQTEAGRKLTRGAKGNDVKLVQQRLTDLGYFDGPISGNYMNQSMDAMKKFQTNNGLKADGIVGEESWRVLFSAIEALDASATPRPTPVPTPVPYAVTVDVKNQAVIVYGRDEQGEFTVPLRKMVCSTGKVGTDSDLGEFVLDGRTARWAYFSLYGSHAQYWTRINEYIAFHSVTYHAVDYKKLNVTSYNMLGSRASHGCIRLLVSEAKWMYDNLGEGVVVTIRDDLPADEELRQALKPPPLNKEYMRPVNTPEPTPEPNYTSDGRPSEPFRTLKKGRTGEDVYWVQRRLQELGYYTGTVTGGFYSGTQAAVKAYQKDHGLRANGNVDEATYESLFGSAEEVAEEAVETTQEMPTVSPPPDQKK